ncbi:MAG: AAA family ATPase [Firmicutes bacterium]|nr:AAA family ATPase [Bacillota bacterium]
MDLFASANDKAKQDAAPLAVRMRPKDFAEFEAQHHIVGEGSLLRRAIEADRLQSMILYGPPGTGKTTLAEIVAQQTKARFVSLNAVMAGVKDIKAVVTEAENELTYYGRKTILFIDEIHRFNKAQQDALLPFVEKGVVILIGATTENPMFTVNKALLSRSRIFQLHPLPQDAMKRLLHRALTDTDKGLGQYRAQVDPQALEHIIQVAGGDARSALNALELAVLTTAPGGDGNRHITLEIAEQAIQRRRVNYTKDGDEHYDVISAFIKSIRGSDPQAAIYWLARMLYAGEDPEYIGRRLLISAAEDIGLADPAALGVAVSAVQAFERLGMPEGRIPLAQATIYLALAPKSNSAYLALDAALQAVEQGTDDGVPNHLRDGSSGGMERLGLGRGYLYPHDYPNHWVDQEYLPEGLQGQCFYHPSTQGEEKKLAQVWQERRSGGERSRS